jgi:hypothetical protein
MGSKVERELLLLASAEAGRAGATAEAAERAARAARDTSWSLLVAPPLPPPLLPLRSAAASVAEPPSFLAAAALTGCRVARALLASREREGRGKKGVGES